jgi:hypothetical protein
LYLLLTGPNTLIDFPPDILGVFLAVLLFFLLFLGLLIVFLGVFVAKGVLVVIPADFLAEAALAA